jgi:protease I
MKVLIISADEFEDTELLVPLYRLQEEDISVDVASLKRGAIKGKHGYEVAAGLTMDEVDPANYSALLLPGGKAPGALRDNPKVQQIVHHFFDRDKPVAAICHGPQILVSAGVLEDRHATCYQSVAPELIEAHVHYEDKPVIVDGRLVTSRYPGDLPYFMREFLKQIKPTAA